MVSSLGCGRNQSFWGGESVTTDRDRLLSLIRDRAFLQGAVQLSSGEQSNFYVDGKMVAMMPEGAHLIGEVVYDHIKDMDFNAIGGLAVGAVPMVTSVAVSCFQHDREAEGFFVRVEAKSHGTKKVIEGRLPEHARVIMVDDVVTSGKSVLQAIDAVEKAGASVVLILSIVDRQAGAEELFKKMGYTYNSIFTKEDVMTHANAE